MLIAPDKQSLPTVPARALGRAPARVVAWDWPTLGLAVVIHLAWAAATWWHRLLEPWMLAAVGGWLIAWHGSLQHETIHDHPTPHRRLNQLIGSAPLALWLPYGAYLRSHVAHHASEDLTFPHADPESRYHLSPGDNWGRLGLSLRRLQSTLLGRLILGPFFEVGGFWASEATRLRRGDTGAWRDWAAHLIGLVLVLLWLRACGFGLLEYSLTFVYPGVALSLLRSFAEHRADPDPQRRIAVVERAPILGLLFLNNNLHAAHHLRPGLAWWRLPAFYRAHRQEILAGNGALAYRGYAEVVRRFALRPHDEILHPDEGSRRAGASLAQAV